MKTILLAAALMLSVSLGQADEGDTKRKRNNGHKAKITYSEHKKKKVFARKKSNPKKYMFAGEGVRKPSRRR